MTRYLQIVAWAIGIGFVLWAVLFGSFWMVRNGCAGNLSAPHCNGGALVDWLGNVVLLGWVVNYQPLIGGVLALGAGAFVLFAAVHQTNTAKADAKTRRQEEFLSAMVQVRALFQDGIAHYTYALSPPTSTLSQRLQLHMPVIAVTHPALAEVLWVYASATDSALALFTKKRTVDQQLRVRDAGEAAQFGMIFTIAAHLYLENYSVLRDADGSTKMPLMDVANLDRLVAIHGLPTPEKNYLLGLLFDFSTRDH